MSDPENSVSMKDGLTEPKPPASLLVINAHPDDQEFTVGGTLAKWASAGTEIVTLCTTKGEAGSNRYTPETLTREDLVRIRESEQRSACRVLGIRQVIFLDYPDGALEPSIELRRDLARVIRRYRPEAVMCGDPSVRFHGDTYINHPDHRAAGEAALAAVFPSAGTRFIFPELLEEGLQPHEVSKVFVHGSERPNCFIDIASVLDIKLAALREHRSQLGEWDPAEMITKWVEEQGKPLGLRAAEAFRVFILSQDF